MDQSITHACNGSPGNIGMGRAKGWRESFRRFPYDHDLMLYRSLRLLVIAEGSLVPGLYERSNGLRGLLNIKQAGHVFMMRHRKAPRFSEWQDV